MALRKEHVVLVLTAGVLGWLGWSSTRATPKAASGKRAPAPALELHPAPDVGLALPQEREGAAVRELFSPPSDTRPLPPLELDTPPLVALPALRPPTEPGPAPALFSRTLRTSVKVLAVPDLFAAAGDAAEEAAPAPAPGKAIRELSPQERAERLNAWKRLYDWYRSNDFRFGRIANPDRFNLSKRPNEDLLFVEVNPETGQPRLPGAPPVTVQRSVASEFGFADTVANQIEIKRAEFGDPLPASQYDQALAFASWCVSVRHSTSRAIEVAEELYTRAAAALKDDPAPRLGLARVHESAFQFEKAFQIYQQMLAGQWSKSPLVLVRLAELEARFRMFDRAEEHLRDAERSGRSLWPVQAGLGRFLLARGRANEAVEHLRLANQYEPAATELKGERAALRCDLAAALVASGDLAGASEWFDKARQADASEPRAASGLLAVSVLQQGDNPAATAPSADERTQSTFEYLLASALALLPPRTSETAAQAKDKLRAAVEADPVRAFMAWRAMSYLAEVTGNSEEALRTIDLALENDPTDVWSLVQRGRILASRDDIDGAIESLKRALDRELDLPDALALLGELLHRKGEWAAADKYLERATMLDPRFASAFALRGVNFLELGDTRAAETALDAALAIEPEHPTARNARAWCFYRRGGEENARAAQNRLREVDDVRRSLPENDPHRVWARAQIQRINDHLDKVVWTDRFERKELKNDWRPDERAGPQVSIHDGVVTLSGTFKDNGRARFYQEKPAATFVAFEARLTIRSGTSCDVGVFVAREQQRSGDSQLEAEVALQRHHEAGKNTLQWRAVSRGQEAERWNEAPTFEWKLDQPVTVRIERSGDSSDTRVRVLFDGYPVVENKTLAALGRTNSPIFLGFYATGPTGAQVALDVDEVEITYRKGK